MKIRFLGFLAQSQKPLEIAVLRPQHAGQKSRNGCRYPTRANKKLPGLIHTLTDDQDQAFLDLVREIAFSYADQVRDDWQHFVTALELQPGECPPLPFAPPSYKTMLPG